MPPVEKVPPMSVPLDMVPPKPIGVVPPKLSPALPPTVEVEPETDSVPPKVVPTTAPP